MDRAAKITRAIRTAITGFSPFSETPNYDNFAVIGREQATSISEVVFEALEKDGYLNAGPATDRRFRITFVITEAIGQLGEPPGNHSQANGGKNRKGQAGVWMRSLRRSIQISRTAGT